MAWTNWGFDGTINEAQWSQMAGLLGNGYVAAGNGDCAVTAVPGARSVSVAAGTLYGDGVVSVNSGAETVAMTTPVNGQWYLICLKREWSTNTASLRAVAGATTTTTTPTVAPTSFPTINTSPGVLTDQPIAWAWCNSANTTVVIFDLRLLPMRTQPVSVPDSVKRDAKFPSPVQGNQVWRDDLGVIETYYALYNVSTNPGGRSVAGWYQEPIGRILQVVQGATTTTVTNNSTTFVSTGLSATIKPIHANSQLFISITHEGVTKNSGSGSNSVRIMLQKDGSAYTQIAYDFGYTGTATYLANLSYAFNITVSASNTNSQTWGTAFANAIASSGVYVQDNGARSTITIMEIAA